MAFLTVAELSSHLYQEVVGEIDRNNTGIAQDAIGAAVAEASGYLSAYDTTAVFAALSTARNPILLMYCKDIAVWHFIQLANPGVEMDLRKDRYDRAIKWLEKVQSGKVSPGLPYPAAVPDVQPNNFIKWGSNPRRPTNY